MPTHSRSDAASAQDGRVPLGFGNLFGSHGDHIGHFYETREEWKSVLVPFLQTGLTAGDKCVYFMSAGAARQELSAGLAAAGIDVDGALASGQLVLDEGKTDPKQMQETLGRALDEIGTRFPLLRWGGDAPGFPAARRAWPWQPPGVLLKMLERVSRIA